MKKFIQVSALLSLLVLFSAAATFAQSSFGTDVNIPFAFNVGDHTYEAGHYIVRVEKLPSGAAALSILDTKTEETQKVLMNATGDPGSSEVKLVFDSIGGQRFLSAVKTSNRSYALIKSKSEKDARKAAAEKSNVISAG